MAIAKLSIDLEARLAGLQAGLDKAGVLAANSAARIEGAFAKVGSTLSAVGAGLAASFGAGALAAFVRSTVNGLDKLNDLADATGASVENLSALEDIAVRTGTSVDTMGDAVVKMNKALADAKPGSDQAAAFDALGLSIKELKALDPVEAFQKLAIALQGFANDGNKARLVQELFGKSLREVAPLLKDVAEAGALVGTVTKQQADEAERFNKELFALQKNATDAARALVGPLVEAVNEVTAVFREGRAQGKNFFETLWAGTRLLTGQDGGGATGSWEDAVTKPSLPGIGTAKAGKSGSGGGSRSAVSERLRLAEFSARQLVEIEEQAANDVAEAWRVWERQQIELSKSRAEAEKEQWRQVFEFIDQQQDEAIEQGQQAVAAAAKAADEWSVFADQAARNIQDTLGDSLEAAMTGNFKSIGDLWKRTLDRMVAEALAAKLAQSLLGDFGKTGNVGGWAGDFFKWASTLLASGKGNAFGPGGVLAFASGGVVDSPTFFGFGGGRAGLMGEAGPEAILPLKRGSDGSLGVASQGRGIVVHQVINVTMSGPGDRRSLTQLQADIGAATQRALARNT